MKKYLGLMVALVVALTLGVSAMVSADSKWVKYDNTLTTTDGAWYPGINVGFKSLNPNAQKAALVVGYGLKGIYSEYGHSDWYMNPVARDEGVIVWGTPADVPVFHGEWYEGNPAYVTQWYKTPGKPPDMTPWKEFCKKYGVDY